MIPIGKCPPERKELSQIGQIFDEIELYLNRGHLDDFDQTVKNCQKSSASIEVVHTPHVPPSESEYFQLTNKLAEELNAKIVLHSGNILTCNWDEVLDEIDLTQTWGLENQPGDAPEYFQNNAIDKFGSVTLDVAHLFMATGSDHFIDEYESILKHHADSIEILHLADSTIHEDGLSFGEGCMDMEETIKLSEKYYDGLATVEVMPSDQEDDLRFINSILS